MWLVSSSPTPLGTHFRHALLGARPPLAGRDAAGGDGCVAERAAWVARSVGSERPSARRHPEGTGSGSRAVSIWFEYDVKGPVARDRVMAHRPGFFSAPPISNASPGSCSRFQHSARSLS